MSRFDSLGDEQVLMIGVAPDWSSKDLLAHLAHRERVAGEQVPPLDAGSWSPKKRTREEVLQINREGAMRITKLVLAPKETPDGRRFEETGDVALSVGEGVRETNRWKELLSLTGCLA